MPTRLSSHRPVPCEFRLMSGSLLCHEAACKTHGLSAKRSRSPIARFHSTSGERSFAVTGNIGCTSPSQAFNEALSSDADRLPWREGRRRRPGRSASRVEQAIRHIQPVLLVRSGGVEAAERPQIAGHCGGAACNKARRAARSGHKPCCRSGWRHPCRRSASPARGHRRRRFHDPARRPARQPGRYSSCHSDCP
jgi:hypothetical protein